jgi:hypothetical protein
VIAIFILSLIRVYLSGKITWIFQAIIEAAKKADDRIPDHYTPHEWPEMRLDLIAPRTRSGLDAHGRGKLDAAKWAEWTGLVCR